MERSFTYLSERTITSATSLRRGQIMLGILDVKAEFPDARLEQ